MHWHIIIYENILVMIGKDEEIPGIKDSKKYEEMKLVFDLEKNEKKSMQCEAGESKVRTASYN